MKRTRLPRFDFYLDEMLAAMIRVKKYTQGLTFEEYVSNELIRDAVIRNFEIIGESVRKVPFSFQKKHRRMPWNHMVSLRNVIAHEFFDVDDDIIWAIIQTDLDANIEELQNILR